MRFLPPQTGKYELSLKVLRLIRHEFAVKMLQFFDCYYLAAYEYSVAVVKYHMQDFSTNMILFKKILQKTAILAVTAAAILLVFQ